MNFTKSSNKKLSFESLSVGQMIYAYTFSIGVHSTKH